MYWFLAAVVLSFVTSSCSGKGCHDVGCAAALTIDVNPSPGSTFAPGTYLVEIDAGSGREQVSCDIRADPSTSWCSQTASAAVVVRTDPGQSGLAHFRITSALRPARVLLRVVINGAELGARVVAPRYSESHPNGSDCEPTCSSASETVTL